MGNVEQVSMAVFASESERDISARATTRYCAFLRAELEVLPSWTLVAAEYRQQLRVLGQAVPPGPRVAG